MATKLAMAQYSRKKKKKTKLQRDSGRERVLSHLFFRENKEKPKQTEQSHTQTSEPHATIIKCKRDMVRMKEETGMIAK